MGRRLYTVDVGYPVYEDDDIQEILLRCQTMSDQIEAHGLRGESGGFGFGYRDMQFVTDRKRIAVKAYHWVGENMPPGGYVGWFKEPGFIRMYFHKRYDDHKWVPTFILRRL